MKRILSLMISVFVLTVLISAFAVNSSAASADRFYYNQLSDMAKKMYDAINTSAMGANPSGSASSTPWNVSISLDLDKTWPNAVYSRPNTSTNEWTVDSKTQAEVNAYTAQMTEALMYAVMALIHDEPELSWFVNIELGIGNQIGLDFSYFKEDLTVTAPYRVYNVTLIISETNRMKASTTGNLADFKAGINVAKAVIGTPATRYDTIKAIYEYICNNVNYATTNIGKREYQTVYSSLLSPSHTTVCAGYAKMFKALCDAYEIPCVLISGIGNYEEHMWTYVQMTDGNWYAVDPTWADRKTWINYNYLLVGSDYLYDSSSSLHIPKNTWDNCVTFNYPTLSKTSYSQPHTHTGSVVYTSNGNGTHTGRYSCCSEIVSSDSCSGGKATCGEKAKCSVCKGYYGDILPHSKEYVVSASESVINLNCKNCGQAQNKITLSAPADLVYDGSEKTVILSSPVGALTVSYEDGSGTPVESVINAGDYKAKVTYGGQTAVLDFKVTPKALTEASLSAMSGIYSGAAHSVTVTVEGLTENEDYTVSYPSDMTNAGRKNIRVIGNGNYRGTVYLAYTVEKKDLTVTAKDQTVFVGGEISDDLSQCTVEGLVEGHVLESLTLTPSDVNVGSVGAVTPSGAAVTDGSGNNVDKNYNIVYNSGKLTVIEHVHEYVFSAVGTDFTANCISAHGSCSKPILPLNPNMADEVLRAFCMK